MIKLIKLINQDFKSQMINCKGKLVLQFFLLSTQNWTHCGHSYNIKEKEEFVINKSN